MDYISRIISEIIKVNYWITCDHVDIRKHAALSLSGRLFFLQRNWKLASKPNFLYDPISWIFYISVWNKRQSFKYHRVTHQVSEIKGLENLLLRRLISSSAPASFQTKIDIYIYMIKNDIHIYVPYSRPNGWTERDERFCGHSLEA